MNSRRFADVPATAGFELFALLRARPRASTFGILGLLCGLAGIPFHCWAQTMTPGQPASAVRSPDSATKPGQLNFRRHDFIDQQQGGIRMASMMVPTTWKVTHNIRWNYADSSHPIRSSARVESPDGSAWVEFFPMEVFTWIEPQKMPERFGSKVLGMIVTPGGISLPKAMEHFVIGAHRGKNPNLKLVSARRVDAQKMAQAFGGTLSEPAEAAVARIRYTVNGRTADEDVFAMLGEGNRIPGPPGPLGPIFERHKPLVYLHTMGATDGNLESVYSLLTLIATSMRVDPIWLQQRRKVQDYLNAEFERIMAAGYARIAAAGEMSRRISANNDAMLARMQASRAAQAQREAASKAAASSSGGYNFNDYIRGVERMKDPYWGTSEHSDSKSYRWTDSAGNYRSSNDPSFNPNVGGAPGTTWQRMEAAR